MTNKKLTVILSAIVIIVVLVFAIADQNVDSTNYFSNNVTVELTEEPETDTPAIVPDSGEPGEETPEAETVEAEEAETEATEGETPEAEVIEAEAIESEAPEAEVIETEVIEGEAPEAEVIETEAVEGEVPEAEVAETEVIEGEAPEAEVIETEVIEGEAPEAEVIENEAVEGEVPEAEVIETEVIESEAPEAEAIETEAVEGEVPEAEVIETEVIESEAPEAEAIETEAIEGEAPEAEVAETEAIEGEAPEAEVIEAETETIDVSRMTMMTPILYAGQDTICMYEEAQETEEGITARIGANETIYLEENLGIWCKVVYANNRGYVKADQLMLMDATDATDEEKEHFRSIDITNDLNGKTSVVAGTEVTLTAHLNGFENDTYTVQWKYSPDGVTMIEIPGATGLSYTFRINKTNVQYEWYVEVTLTENEE